MHRPVPLANSATIVVVALSLICWVFVTVLPEIFLFGLRIPGSI